MDWQSITNVAGRHQVVTIPAITTASGIEMTIKNAVINLRREFCTGFVVSTSDAADSRSLIYKTQDYLKQIVVAQSSIMFLFFRKVQMTQQPSPGPSQEPPLNSTANPAQDASDEPSAVGRAAVKNQKTYRLRMMVLVRIMAEVAALVIVAILPAVFLCLGKFQILPLPWKIAMSIMAAGAATIVPFYGFVTWKVRTDDEGLTAVTAFKRKSIAWREVRALVKRSTWNFPRYVVEGSNEEASFPVWLDNLNELLERIKEHLPAGSASFNPYRMFKQDPVILGMHMAQSAAGLLFLGVLWFFYVETLKKGNQSDSVMVLIFCLIATGILVWRTAMILLMPLSVEVKLEFAVIKTCFFTVALPWEKILSVKPTMPLLPEGFMIKTKKGWYLIGNGMDRSDELESALADKISDRIEEKK